MKQSPRNTTSGSLGRQSYLLASDSSKPWSILRVYHNDFVAAAEKLSFLKRKPLFLLYRKSCRVLLGEFVSTVPG